jgi:hypothetical protein
MGSLSFSLCYSPPQDFLKRAELREYELERDKRLQSDVRLRGRL